MQLEWFRHHKKVVYVVIAPIIILSFAFLFGSGDALHRSSSGARGPSVTYRVGNTERKMTPSEVVTLRFLLTQFGQDPFGYRGDHRVRSSDQAAFYQVAVGTAKAAGFGLGNEELKEALRNEVREQIMRKDNSDVVANDENYRKLLNLMQLTPTQFERLVDEFGTMEKYFRYLSTQSRANDEELFIAYLRDKEVVRMRYKLLKSEDFVAQAKEPADDKIREFYDANKDNVKELGETMFTKPKASADLIYLDTEKLFGGKIEPQERDLQRTYDLNKDKYKLETKAGEPEKFKPLAEVKAEVEKLWRETEVKNYYERYKRMHWQDKPKAGEPAPKPGEEKFLAFDAVKADVEKKWLEDWESTQKRDRAMARMNTLKTEIDEAEKAHEKAEEAKKPEERKPFDLAAFLKSKEVTHWVSDTLPEEEFRKGKAEVNAKNPTWVADLFYLKKDTDNPALKRSNEEQVKRFRGPLILEKGALMLRIKDYNKEEALPLETAKPKIIERLKIQEAVELAEKEANKLKEDWSAGKEVPQLDTLEEVRGDKESESPIVKQYFEKPVPIGEPIVADEPADKSTTNPSPHHRYFVGFAVDRELPTRKGFHADTAWSRDQKRDEIENSHSRLTLNSVFRQLREQGKVVGDVSGDPPLFGDRGE